MTQREVENLKRMLSGFRVHKFGPMPADRFIWLNQMDECASALGIENVYRPPVQMAAE